MLIGRRVAVAAVIMLALQLSAAVAAAGNLEPGTQAKVTGTAGWGLRLREGPATDRAILITMPEGQAVDVLEGPSADAEGSTWYKVAIGDLVGWSSGTYLTSNDVGVDVRGLRAAGRAVVSNTGGSGLRLRSGPGLSESILAVMPEGDAVAVTGGPALDASGTAWYQIVWHDTVGWSMGLYLWRQASSQDPVAPTPGAVGTRPPEPSLLGDRIVAVAQRYLGSPYRFGGSSPDAGFDCSGFVQYVLRQVGISIGRDAPAQYQYGAEVPREHLVPGDLVFFQNTYMPGLSHVGIYVGNGQFIHANDEATGVILSSLDDIYWAPRWYGAKRLQ